MNRLVESTGRIDWYNRLVDQTVRSSSPRSHSKKTLDTPPAKYNLHGSFRPGKVAGGGRA